MSEWFRKLLIRTRILTPRYSNEALANLIAERSLSEALVRLRQDTTTMTPAELRGYVRARVHRVVRRQTLAAVPGQSASELETLVQSALQRTTQLIVSQPQALPVTALPSVHVRLRIAG